MKPNGRTYNPDPKYLDELVLSTTVTRTELCKLLHIDDRTLRRYLAGERQFPYSIQFALECLVLEP